MTTVVIVGDESEKSWETLAKTILQIEMKRRSFTYEMLTEKLNEYGANENVRNVRNKVARGKFSASFMVKCFVVMGVKSFSIELDEKMADQFRQKA